MIYRSGPQTLWYEGSVLRNVAGLAELWWALLGSPLWSGWQETGGRRRSLRELRSWLVSNRLWTHTPVCCPGVGDPWSVRTQSNVDSRHFFWSNLCCPHYSLCFGNVVPARKRGYDSSTTRRKLFRKAPWVALSLLSDPCPNITLSMRPFLTSIY